MLDLNKILGGKNNKKRETKSIIDNVMGKSKLGKNTDMLIKTIKPQKTGMPMLGIGKMPSSKDMMLGAPMPMKKQKGNIRKDIMNIIGDRKSKQQNNFLRQTKGVNMARFGDYDKDGVINGLDCAWKDPTRHGVVTKAKNWFRGRGYQEDYDIERKQKLQELQEQELQKNQEISRYEQKEKEKELEMRSFDESIGAKAQMEAGKRDMAKQKFSETFATAKRKEQLKDRYGGFVVSKMYEKGYKDFDEIAELGADVKKKLFIENPDLKTAYERYKTYNKETYLAIKARRKARTNMLNRAKSAKAFAEKYEQGRQSLEYEKAMARKQKEAKISDISEEMIRQKQDIESSYQQAKEADKSKAKEILRRPVEAGKEKLIEKGYQREGKLSFSRVPSKLTGYIFETAKRREQLKAEDRAGFIQRASFLVPVHKLKSLRNDRERGSISSKEYEMNVLREARLTQRKQQEQVRLDKIRRVQEQAEMLDARRKQAFSRLNIARTQYEMGQLAQVSSGQGNLFTPRRNIFQTGVVDPRMADMMNFKKDNARQQINEQMMVQRLQTGNGTDADRATMSMYNMMEYMNPSQSQNIQRGYDMNNYMRNQIDMPRQEQLETYQPTFYIPRPEGSRFDPDAPKFVWRKKYGNLTRKTYKTQKDEDLKYGKESKPSTKKRGQRRYPSSKPLMGYQRVYAGSGRTIARGRPRVYKNRTNHYPKLMKKPKRLGFSRYVRTYGQETFRG